MSSMPQDFQSNDLTLLKQHCLLFVCVCLNVALMKRNHLGWLPICHSFVVCSKSKAKDSLVEVVM
jgi:hypothetical protein